MTSILSDLELIRSEILKKGYYVYKNLASSQDCISLRNIILKKIQKSPKYNIRINSQTIPDYTHKRSHDETHRTTRYYSFFHNFSKWTDVEKKILIKGLDIRNQVELPLVKKNQTYKEKKSILQDYNIFTKYEDLTGMLPPHRDWQSKLKYPLLQFNLILSEQNVDFTLGEFIFEDYNLNKIKIHEDLKIRMGDALLFDKYLLHSVDITKNGTSNIGRCSLLIGARAYKTSYFLEKKFLFKEKLKNFFNIPPKKL